MDRLLFAHQVDYSLLKSVEVQLEHGKDLSDNGDDVRPLFGGSRIYPGGVGKALGYELGRPFDQERHLQCHGNVHDIGQFLIQYIRGRTREPPHSILAAHISAPPTNRGLYKWETPSFRRELLLGQFLENNAFRLLSQEKAALEY